MRGERYQNRIAIFLIVLLGFVALPLTVNLPRLWFLWVPVVAAIALLPAIFLRETDLVTGLLAPSQAIDAVAANLRAAGVAVTAEQGAIRARIGALTAVKFLTRTTEQGTVVSYETGATPAGWALLITLVASIVGSVPAAVLGLLFFLSASRFARAHAPSAFQGGGAPSAPASDELHRMLAGGISSALGTAREALETQRKAYTNALGLAGIALVTVFIAVLVGLFVALNGFNLETGDWNVPIIGAFAATFAVGGAVAVALRRRFSTRTARYRAWGDRLADTFDRELSHRPAEPASPSTFEPPAEASTQGPDLLQAQPSAGPRRGPGAPHRLPP